MASRRSQTNQQSKNRSWEGKYKSFSNDKILRQDSGQGPASCITKCRGLDPSVLRYECSWRKFEKPYACLPLCTNTENEPWDLAHNASAVLRVVKWMSFRWETLAYWLSCIRLANVVVHWLVFVRWLLVGFYHLCIPTRKLCNIVIFYLKMTTDLMKPGSQNRENFRYSQEFENLCL